MNEVVRKYFISVVEQMQMQREKEQKEFTRLESLKKR